MNWTLNTKMSVAIAMLATGSALAHSQNLVSVTLASDGVSGGETVRGNVGLDAAAGIGGIEVALSTNNSAKTYVPPFVTVRQGRRNQAFNLLTRTVKTNTEVSIGATVGGTTLFTSIILFPGGLAGIEVDPDLNSGDIGSGRVWLTAVPANDTVVELRSSNPAAASVPGSVNVLTIDRYSQFFDITAGDVFVDTAVTIRARLDNGLRYDVVVVHPAPPEASFRLAPTFRAMSLIATSSEDHSNATFAVLPTRATLFGRYTVRV